MAEYIDKAVALSIHEPTKSNRHYQTDNLDDAYGQGWDDALCSIEHIPAADVAPVVRCKGCTHYDMGVCLKIYSDGNAHPEAWQSRGAEDFCSYGERKDKGAENG